MMKRDDRGQSRGVDNSKILGNRVTGNHITGNHRGLPLRERNRRSIRLRGYDYSRAGAYFVTICIQNRACLFGEIIDGKMTLNNAGRMIQAIWDEIPKHYPGIDIDAFQIMPNHVHGIIIVGAAPCGRPDIGQPQGDNGQPQGDNGQPQGDNGQPQGVAPTGTVGSLSLPDVVHRFKTMTTNEYIRGVKQYGWPRFNGRLWQRNYYEHIVRDENELNRIRQYIIENPAKWQHDRENPLRARRAMLQLQQLRETVSQYGEESWMI